MCARWWGRKLVQPHNITLIVWCQTSIFLLGYSLSHKVTGGKLHYFAHAQTEHNKTKQKNPRVHLNSQLQTCSYIFYAICWKTHLIHNHIRHQKDMSSLRITTSVNFIMSSNSNVQICLTLACFSSFSITSWLSPYKTTDGFHAGLLPHLNPNLSELKGNLWLYFADLVTPIEDIVHWKHVIIWQNCFFFLVSFCMHLRCELLCSKALVRNCK